MMEEIWNKKIVVIVDMDEADIADQFKPLPLITQFSWNAYLGFYYDLILDYFQMYAPFPYSKDQFYLNVQGRPNPIASSTIVYHLIQQEHLSLEQPLYLQCHFRSRNEIPQIDLRRHFKNNLKASTALKYGKYGASILMVQMSINNVQKMLNSFRDMNYNDYIGSNNFESDDLGYSFLIHRAEKIAVKFVIGDLIMERSAEKEMTFQQFVQGIFGSQILVELNFRLHMVPLKSLDIKMGYLQKYCHPDGYLYIHV